MGFWLGGSHEGVEVRRRGSGSGRRQGGESGGSGWWLWKRVESVDGERKRKRVQRCLREWKRLRKS